mmetsp:Transcript_58803/g.187717  ORF Transcript_58803/g.187717 Transcript_58803/m.187717 type:complete len:95 (-) Transcript_58803:445-729(-)
MERASSAAIEEHLSILKIRHEHETYAYRTDIQTILFNLLSDCVKEAPKNPIDFMITWLTKLRDGPAEEEAKKEEGKEEGKEEAGEAEAEAAPPA